MKTILNMSIIRENESDHTETYPLCCSSPILTLTKSPQRFGVFKAN